MLTDFLNGEKYIIFEYVNIIYFFERS